MSDNTGNRETCPSAGHQMIIVVEGIIAAGKTTWCHKHAAEVTIPETGPCGGTPDPVWTPMGPRAFGWRFHPAALGPPGGSPQAGGMGPYRSAGPWRPQRQQRDPTRRNAGRGNPRFFGLLKIRWFAWEVQEMNTDQIKGNWKQLVGKAKEKCGRLTDDDWKVIEGKRAHREASGALWNCSR
jgi:hypothetical protein